jgi:hypothetical protein
MTGGADFHFKAFAFRSFGFSAMDQLRINVSAVLAGS